jgi:sigma-B regulation protein RsbU (phosphoserine phosphatase)|tara:strand:- start:79 stop:480 length:402 start_codon:yes stop_codon:yes gene_type:complete
VKTRVIFVDDEESIHTIINLMFSDEVDNEELELMNFMDGDECLSYLQQNLKDQERTIIFSDINMPKMDGISLASEVTKFLPQLDFNFISAYVDFDEKLRQAGLQNLKLFTKPVEFDEIREHIYRFVGCSEQNV